MKPGSGISKPILFIALAAVVLLALLVWVAGPWRRGQTPAEVANVPAGTNATDATQAAIEPETPGPAPTLPDGSLPPVVPISLTPVLRTSENREFANQPFTLMPRGTQDLGGIEFWIEGMIELQSRASADENKKYRSKIGIPLAPKGDAQSEATILHRGSNVASIHLLGATRYAGEGQAPVADLVWHYEDNTTRRTAITFERDVRDWIRQAYETPGYLPYAFSKVVWAKPMTGSSPRFVRLYRFSYANPQPAKAVRELEFVSAMETPSLFLVGVTLDPLKLGQRPDDSPNLEPTDATPPHQIDIYVQTSTGQPIPNAEVGVRAQQLAGQSPRYLDRTMKADSTGMARVNFPPPQNLERLEIRASPQDFMGRKMVWQPPSGDVVPASHIFKLEEGISIGGTVVDETENPLPGVKLNFYRFWTGNDEMNQKGDQPDFNSRRLTTDAQGAWQLKGVPPQLVDRISAKVTHPEFVEASLSIGNDSNQEAKLRAGTHKTVLKRGLIVKGKVMDADENPLAGAQVWAGKVNYGGPKSSKTDAAGAFEFKNLNEGEMQFSVMAKGWKPEVRNLTVKPGMNELIFKLSRGGVIRGIVKDEAGEPVSGVRIALEDSGGGVAHDYEFEMTSGKDGRFEWNGAPERTKNFCFLKGGYEAKRRQTLKLDEENVVTLRKGRKIQGWVVDADTEKPITKFRAGVGRSYSESQFYADYPGMKEFADANGAFTLEVNESENNHVKAEADEYAGKVEKLPEAQDGVVQVILRLKPSAALRGIVVTSDGTPVAGASVAFTTEYPGSRVTLKNGKLTTYDRERRIVTTDASGEFVLTSPPETGGMVVAAAESGFASAPVPQVRASGRLVLQGFGRIEGTIKVGGQPVAGHEFTFSMQSVGVGTDWAGYKAASDEHGRFAFEKVPPGEGSVVRLIKTSPNSWTHSHNTTVVVASGQTAHVNFGESGAVIKGQVRLETPPAEGEKITFSGSLTMPMPRPPNIQTPAEAQAFYSSPEWKELTKQRKHYGVIINSDGVLSMDSIPPGTYTLNVSAMKPGSEAWDHRPVATGSTTVVVPDNAGSSTIDVPEILLKPLPTPKPAAPQVVLPK